MMLSVGQVVVLKSGGPDMVVTSSKDDGAGQKVGVLWYAKNNGRSQFNTADNLPASAFMAAADGAMESAKSISNPWGLAAVASAPTPVKE